MQLRHFNEVLFAALGSLLLLGIVIAAVIAGVQAIPEEEETRGIVVAPEPLAGEPAMQRPPQSLVFCSPTVVDGSAFQYFPVAAVSAVDARRAPVVSMAAEMKFRSLPPMPSFDCNLAYAGDGSRIFNVVVRNPDSGEQYLLLNGFGQIDALQSPARECEEGIGATPCGVLIWNIRRQDTSGDGAVNGDDALVAYRSDLSARELLPLTPPDATVLSMLWHAPAREFLFRIRRDTTGDSLFTDEDGSEMLAVSLDAPGEAQGVIDPALVSALERVVK